MLKNVNLSINLHTTQW